MGGAYGDGVIFSMDTNGGGYTVLHNFNDTLGENPWVSSLTLSGSTIYGMAGGGGSHDYGVIFSINTNGNGYTILHEFNDTLGKDPEGSLTLSGNTLYGTTQFGGTDSGVIFSINTNGTGYIVLHNFNDTLGISPGSSLTLSGGTLYGTTDRGGTYRDGVIFSINTNGGGYTVLHNFNDTLGEYPFRGALTLSGSTFYGMTGTGGVDNDGVIFSFDTTIVTAINKVNKFTSAINLYPNPNDGVFNLQWIVSNGQGSVGAQNFAPYNIEIFNIYSEMIYSTTTPTPYSVST